MFNILPYFIELFLSTDIFQISFTGRSIEDKHKILCGNADTLWTIPFSQMLEKPQTSKSYIPPSENFIRWEKDGKFE